MIYTKRPKVRFSGHNHISRQKIYVTGKMPIKNDPVFTDLQYKQSPSTFSKQIALVSGLYKVSTEYQKFLSSTKCLREFWETRVWYLFSWSVKVYWILSHFRAMKDLNTDSIRDFFRVQVGIREWTTLVSLGNDVTNFK